MALRKNLGTFLFVKIVTISTFYTLFIIKLKTLRCRREKLMSNRWGAGIPGNKEPTITGKTVSILRVISFTEGINTKALTIVEIKA